MTWMRLLLMVVILNVQCSMFNVYAQIVIGGHVYGGGNAGDMTGNATVTVRAGDINRVFGGARMANVEGRAFVNIDGAHASNYIVINRLYGGNDIAGTIGTGFIGKSDDELPELPDDVKDHADNNGVGKTWNALVLISSKMTPAVKYTQAEIDAAQEGDDAYGKTTDDIKTPATVAEDNKSIYIGQLFGGGDGEYTYGSRTEDSKTVYYAIKDNVEVATSKKELTVPDLGKTFVDIHGGSIVYAYGGGNNATVTERTVISMDNPSAVVSSIIDATNPNANTDGELLTNDRFEKKMGINTSVSYPSSDAYQIGRLFGGNNKADMAIRPRWNLQQGKVRNLYGGGNEGRMTSPEGLLMQIEGAGMVVDNVYGGCRKADVRPMKNGTDVSYSEVKLPDEDNPNNIPAGYASRVRVVAGHVNNVYGGNDISGNVYAGNTVGIMTHIYGDVYGGGNGSYAYTDNPALKDDPHWSDFYYNPDEVLAAAGITGVSDDLKSVTALNLIRPNAEKVSILVRGTEANPTIVDGGLYVGGNSASLRENVAGASSGNQTHIKIGSYTIIDNVFLGNNGANMIKYNKADAEGRGEGVLRTFARYIDKDGNLKEYEEEYTPAIDDSKFNSMVLTNETVFAKYMEGCAMKVKSTVVFEGKSAGETPYKEYSTQFGSFYCGGNVGSMITDGKTTIDFNDKVIIYDKVVGGCNNANVYKTAFNAQYLGGMLGDPDPVPTGSPEGTIGDKLELNFGGLKIQPKRWVDENDKSKGLEWNTWIGDTKSNIDPSTASIGETNDPDDLKRRFKGGNIYGGCYNTGHVNGNVVINLNASIVDRKGMYAVFDQVQQNEGEAILYNNTSYNITERRSGVILDEQGMDPLGKALNVFGGGFGGDSEIWGSTTINLNAGYTFQIFGGGEKGPIGKADEYNTTTGELEYSYNPAYSCYINMRGADEGVYRGHADDSDDMAEAEFIYGGSFEAPIAGNTVINLGNGRIFNSFAGSCNANILGHTETYIGRQVNSDGTYTDGGGFPWIRDHVYGGNDLGGQILGSQNFTDRIDNDIKAKVYNPKNKENADVASASAYMEYIQGRVDYIFGGCYGDYDYTNVHYSQYTYSDGKSKKGFSKPRLDNAFVNFKPNNHTRNAVTRIYGAGQGRLKGIGVDSMQNRSYVLLDIPQNITKYQSLAVFGAGANCGLGMGVNPQLLVDHKNNSNEDVEGLPERASAIIDLVKGQIKNAYGGSFAEGVTRRTVVNVPSGSTIQMDSIFGGAYGADPMYPCDVYEAQVNYQSEDARVTAIFGGNNSADRTLYGQVNVNVPVWQKNGYMGTVYGGGFGKDTWSQYTEINLLNGAHVWEVYGGGYGGKVLNTESLVKWRYEEGDAFDLSLPGYENRNKAYTDKDNKTFYLDEGLNSPLAHAVQLDGKKYNTNVHIYKGATVERYAYGGGLGADAVVSGTTYIDLLGGTVGADLYAGGTSGAVQDLYKVGAKSNSNPNGFTAGTTAYIEGGSVRNVYGGGWEGDVGYHDKTVTSTANDILGKTNVVIGIRQDQASVPEGYGYYKGVPAIQRNAYGGGEGGAIFGETNLTMNNGYVGYYYSQTEGTDTPDILTDDKYDYIEKLHDETWTDHVGKDRLSDCGNLFGGGYDDNSSVDESNVTMWGGIVRNSIFGGGEIATIGRGKTKESGEDNKDRVLEAIYKSGSTHVEMYNGHVKRNVFGGGKGYNILGYGGVHGFYTDGYVFGQTNVHIHGGEIGTDAGLAEGYGNVFGGGDVGFVYGKGVFSIGTQAKSNTGSPNHIYYYDNEGHLTEDCAVVIAPMLQVKPGNSVSYDNKTYGPYEYVPTDYLNTLSANKTDNTWRALFTGDKKADGSVYEDDPVERGVHIHNAVFAGGNVSSNSESYSNATTVFGNTTATLYDVFHRDFITVGTEHTGGLYGGGNLSVVGGYRELNITNYGTDYYGMDEQISLEKYQTLTNRERAYFRLEYQCQKAYGDYKVGDRISEEEYNKLSSQYQSETHWKQYGFCSIYAGRLLNTIQRADFCGVFGSRLVLQGAKDRVADVADATEYTINRVGEVSLNQKRSVIDADLTLKQGVTPAEDPSDQSPDDYENSKNAIHGNYFGIYSVVNYLGSLTSDVHFKDYYRYVDKGKTYTDKTQTYYDWKKAHLEKRDRNNGTALNQVALASGVFLELTTENSTPSKKIYGTVTGIIELDLINVKKDIEGGGYVYARNEHGERSEISHVITLLSAYNKKDGDEALTNKIYTYSTTALNHQTSGNFIHKSKRIVDDCYPNNGVYNDGYVKSPAHYWFIKGEVYIYDQKVSAYAGSATAYSKEVKIPLTITAGSNGKLQLLNIQPSLYAYYADTNRDETKKITADGIDVDNESVTYHLNDVITWWDWHQLSQSEQKYFVKETYVNVDSCNIDGRPYSAGTYVLENDASVHGGNANQTAWKTFQAGNHTVLNIAGEPVTDLTTLFHPSNNISHDTGYVLTLDMDSPKDWGDWYVPIDSNSGLQKIRKDAYDALSDENKAKYRVGPTYKLKTGETSGLYGQREYAKGEVISQEVYNDYENTVSLMNPRPTEGQATVEPAYVALEDFGNTQAGNAIGKTAYDGLGDNKSKFAPAMVCVNTIQLGEEDFVLLGELVDGTDDNLDALAAKYKKYNNDKINADQINDAEALKYIKDHLSNAYYIKSGGLYGGQYFVSGTNYSALKSWCTLSDSRTKFDYNYDALDVLVDPLYHGEGTINTYYHAPYSEIKSVEYTAAYTGGTSGTETLTYTDGNSVSHTLGQGSIISSTDYENYIPNEQLHYTRIQVDKGSDTQTVYIVTQNIIDHGTPYAKGQDISEKDFNALSSESKALVATKTFQKHSDETQILYFCLDDYRPSISFNPVSGEAGKAGSVISATTFTEDVPNKQKDFTIQGSEPTETTTLYVSRESNAKDVTAEKVISVVYQYTYYESDDEGEGVSLVNELHVVNIHLKLESGAPEIGPLTAPPAVLPGNPVGLKAPSVNPGLYEILTNGWEMFVDETDAMMHRNGTPFTNNGTPLYWYQNQKVWLAFYSKTYLGKTYSNYVPLTVANYHDIDAVMKDKAHHLYVDHPGVERNSKIYIDNRDCESDETKSELDLLKDFFDLSVSGLAGHASLDDHVKGGADLEFILNSDVSPKAYTNWVPIGDETQCFSGNLHGDGYTISGLNNSLFGKLCGNVYNLGVTGSFTSAGIVDTGDGYVENCWIRTTGTPATGVKAVFGVPGDASRKQVVNCYYPSTKNYTAGDAHPMTETQFYNGTVAFNLNGFYLNKRYYDKNKPSGKAYPYQYLKSVNGTVPDEMSTSYYPASYAFYPLDVKKSGNYGYVEDRYADGDFIYAGGTIPEAYDDRMRVVSNGIASTVTYSPIWPDDYIFFGQKLTFGHHPVRAHEEWPTHIAKNSGRLPLNDESNRVYRSPAYYQSNAMDVAHYNLNAYLAAKSAPKTITDQNLKDAYPNMTAIDFYGHNDNTWALGFKSEGFAPGSPAFYPPLLDDDEGLLSIVNNGETPNLLVYAPSAEAKQNTVNVLANYFVDPAYSSYYIDNQYRCVASAPTSSIHGHLVQSSLLTTSDHLLVDKSDFNCPIEYTMGDGYRMWYQRTPDNYVGRKKADKSGFIANGAGWEGLSLPFTAEIVTTNKKGEITHFYSDGDNWKGHEYWLREFKGKKEGTVVTNGILTADFSKLAAGTVDKKYTNTFLWDYYYSYTNREDLNTDQYPDASYKYYSVSHNYTNYPRLAKATPYIIGFPGERYYEFDLSGEFEAKTAKVTPAKLTAQIITFASDEGVTIGVSDTELAAATADGYTFVPNYAGKTLTSAAYILNTNDANVDQRGNSYQVKASNAETVPFRPYFIGASNLVREGTRSIGQTVHTIIFSDEQSQLEGEVEHGDPKDGLNGTLYIYTKKDKIYVESSLNYKTDVRVVTPAGITVAAFDVEPGQTVEVQADFSGLYIVHTLDGKYTKKVAVKRE